MPKEAILTGILLLLSFFDPPCSVAAPSKKWMEPVLLWAVICMPTGSGKYPLYGFLVDSITTVRSHILSGPHSTWLLHDASYEKMGNLMSGNNGKMLAMYDKPNSFF